MHLLQLVQHAFCTDGLKRFWLAKSLGRVHTRLSQMMATLKFENAKLASISCGNAN